MKTKEQILEWLDKQPWKDEFYEEAFINPIGKVASYNHNLILKAFDLEETKSGTSVWLERDTEFRKWYNSNDKPMSWEEYCEQNPIKEGEYFIAANCAILDLKHEPRDVNSDVNVMSKDLCEAFLAYMKLIQLRNAWVKDCENGDNEEYLKIVYTEARGFYYVYLGKTGLSFPKSSMAEEFINTFKDLLEVAKPLI